MGGLDGPPKPPRRSTRPGTRRAVLFRLALPLLETLFERAEALAQRRHLFAQPIGLGLAVALRLRAGGAGHHGAPPGAARPLLEHALHLALVRDDPLQARLHGPLDELLPRLAVLDELVEKGGRQPAPMVALVLEDDLRERHRGEVLAERRGHHRDLLARPDHLLDLFERHVPTL